MGIRPAAGRLWAGLVAGGPGLVLLALYGLRLMEVHEDPSMSPGTPEETVFAVMVAAMALASFVFARAVMAGRMPRFLSSIGVIALGAGVLGLCVSMAVMA